MTKHDVHKKILELVEKGHTRQTIARELGMSYQAVRGMINRMIERGELQHEGKVRDPRFVQRVVELHREGKTVAQISLEVGRNMSVIYAVLRELIKVGAIDGHGRTGRPPMPPEMLEKIEQMSKEGYPLAEIAHAVNRSVHHVVHIRAKLRAEGRIPQKRLRHHGGGFNFTPQVHEKIVRMVNAGHSLTVIGAAFGLHSETIKRYLVKHGMQTKRQSVLVSPFLGRRI